MRYFAMIDGRRCGPYELDELVRAGVRPDTYVWCKGMDDWEQARNVADVCRQMRRHLAGIDKPDDVRPDNSGSNPFAGPTAGGTLAPRQNTPGNAAADTPPRDSSGNNGPDRFSRYLGDERLPSPQEADPKPDLSRRPPSLLAVSILATLICFPLTGLVAVYYSVMTSRLWRESTRQTDTENTESYRRMAWDYSRATKMWIGISFFMGLMLWSFLIRFFM